MSDEKASGNLSNGSKQHDDPSSESASKKGILDRKFSKGDLVRLKSGGPVMTVDKTEELLCAKTGVLCKWFDGNQLQSGLFEHTSLLSEEEIPIRIYRKIDDIEEDAVNADESARIAARSKDKS